MMECVGIIGRHRRKGGGGGQHHGLLLEPRKGVARVGNSMALGCVWWWRGENKALKRKLTEKTCRTAPPKDGCDSALWVGDVLC